MRIAPWSKVEVANLEVLQKKLKLYNCPACGCILTPTPNGWVCKKCGYDRDWAYTQDANGTTLSRRLK